jgi:hypothetical protein
VYLMADSWEERETKHHQDIGATGTVALRCVDWNRVWYDRRYVGYGGEDGKLLQDIYRKSFRVCRFCRVFHIAHVPNSNQRNFRGRTDFHNRDFNIDHFSDNCSLDGSATPAPDDASTDIAPARVWPQFFGFELGRTCNRAQEHCGKCPSIDHDRYGQLPTSRTVDDDTILQSLHYAYDDGFAGHVVWHYYNEPLLSWPRMRPLMQRIAIEIPGVKFTLWTNGDLILRPWPETNLQSSGAKLRKSAGIDPRDLILFDTCWVSNYDGIYWDFLAMYVPHVNVLDGALDTRKLATPPSRSRCLRPFNELIIDHYGNGHLCCADWRGTAGVGSIFDQGLPAVVARYMQLRDLVALSPMPSNAPSICAGCTIRCAGLGVLVPSVVPSQHAYVRALADSHRNL